MAADSQGDVFVSNAYGNSVEKFSANGTLLQILSDGLTYPGSLAVDNRGDVFVGNVGNSNSTVEEFGVQLLGVSPPAV